MSQVPAAVRPNLGFLTVVQDGNGYAGGYLVTNPWGRPVEFRLSTAVQPNRVHQILYGKTLRGANFCQQSTPASPPRSSYGSPSTCGLAFSRQLGHSHDKLSSPHASHGCMWTCNAGRRRSGRDTCSLGRFAAPIP